jgi:ATP-dependent 26S proteasome regulatory subunit
MKAVRTPSWSESNQRYLTLTLVRIRALLEEWAGSEAVAVTVEDDALRKIAVGMASPPAIESLCTLFGLSPFERDVLLLCAGIELDSRISTLCASVQGEPIRNYPTFSLALSLFPEAHWSALTPAAPLRWWRMLELGSGTTLTQSPLRIDERILHYLAGASHIDDRLMGYVEPVESPEHLVSSHKALAEQIAASWSNSEQGRSMPVIQLVGIDQSARRDVAASAGALLGIRLCTMRAETIPSSPAESEALMRLWEREAILSNLALMIVCHEADATQALRWAEMARFPVVVSSRERLPFDNRHILTFDVMKPTVTEQHDLWSESLGAVAARLNGHMDLLVTQFDLDAQSIEAIAAGVLKTGSSSDLDLRDSLWQACRSHAHPRLGDLAQRIQPIATWDDLVLPDAQIETLRDISTHVRQRMKVYETWGFAAKSSRGLGISALFAGVSGTGKTMAAEVLANELQLDLYRIDLSQVVSKYIGETEKNLRRVFDAAEEGGAILLFDEADALFGKRSEVKDSHDRYANVEVSYLLQRMESYRGLAILTTNMKEALDSAFLRRIRFVVQFPFPDAEGRAEIWRRVFPAQTPTEGLDVLQLAHLNVAGGNIRNIAMNAAFLAADASQPVRMSHLKRAAGTEYAKLERPLSENETGGWV